MMSVEWFDDFRRITNCIFALSFQPHCRAAEVQTGARQLFLQQEKISSRYSSIAADRKNDFREEGDTKMCDTKQGQQLRSSLRKTHTSDQNGSKDADPDKHVRFACPKDSTFKCDTQFSSIEATPDCSNEDTERMSPAQRKRNITPEEKEECEQSPKKCKPNELIIRLSQALETLLRNSKLKEIDRKIEESRENAEALFDRALSLIDLVVTYDMSTYELEVLAKETKDRRSVISAQREKDIREVEAAFRSANELLSEVESCFAAVATSVEEKYEDDSGIQSFEAEDEPSFGMIRLYVLFESRKENEFGKRWREKERKALCVVDAL
uniref:Uncharacterized protein n=1 Tax=Parascaris univalens TaxID=6257 RepID=A0A915A6H5_PARUN